MGACDVLEIRPDYSEMVLSPALARMFADDVDTLPPGAATDAAAAMGIAAMGIAHVC